MVQSKECRGEAREQIYRFTDNGAKVVRMQSLPPGMRMDGAIAEIDALYEATAKG
jgi:hypothetical protein